MKKSRIFAVEKNVFMGEILFKRKIYDQLLKWKQESNGQSALLVEGARCVGKSTIVRTFAENEYDSYPSLSPVNADLLKCTLIFPPIVMIVTFVMSLVIT